ncbi:putative transmembrane protein [Mycobacterium triplex]|nr:putative transmembrane protein [Mycobacterium triplex]
MPAFSSPVDCTPWVIGGLWPAELSTATDETATLAEYLEKDLQRIAGSANKQLGMVKRAGLTDVGRRAAEARVIEEARARAVRRVESTIRQLEMMKAQTRARRQTAQVARRFSTADLEKTQIIPAVRAAEADVAPTIDETQVMPVVAAASDVGDRTLDQTQVMPAVTAAEPAVPVAAPVAEVSADDEEEREASGGRHRAPSEDSTVDVAMSVQREFPEAAVEPEAETARLQKPIPSGEPANSGAEPEPELEAEPAVVSEPEPEVVEAPPAPVNAESDSERLQRLLAFVVRQEPGLNWAVGDLADGTTLLVTDLAHGWIPPGITLPAGVRLLTPGRRTGKAAALLGEAARTATYTPGDRVGRATDFAPTESSAQPRELPAVEDFGWELGRVTHWRDGLPRLVHTLAKAATAGTGVVEEEAELLRVHLDTARYQLLSQYPDVVPALLLNCLLLAATESSVAGDATSANYHLAWFQKLAEPPASQWTAEI